MQIFIYGEPLIGSLAYFHDITEQVKEEGVNS